MGAALSTRYERARIVRPERLDHAPPQEARQSLADLRVLNRWFGGHAILRQLLREQVCADEEFTLLDVGAASGDNGRCVQRAFPRARVISLDYQLSHLIGSGPQVAGDAFALPFAPDSIDFVFCALFLHHFPEPQVQALLASFRSVCRRAVLVSDLERHRLAHAFVPATRWLFRWHSLTLHDAPVSVQAGFRPAELRHLAEAAGLQEIRVRRHAPWFRLSLVGRKRLIPVR